MEGDEKLCVAERRQEQKRLAASFWLLAREATNPVWTY
jgi:hypothetical protein